MKPSISVIIPAYNEAGNIVNTTRAVLDAVHSGGFGDYEILIFDDGSSDDTGKIADALHTEDPRVTVIHNRPNKGFGYNFQKGIELATKEYVGLIPGDNEVTPESVRDIIARVGDADITCAYTTNKEVRPRARRVISWMFTFINNTLFGLQVKYFNGPAFIRTSLLRRVRRRSLGFAFMMEILVQLIRAGYSYVEVGMKIQPRAYGAPTAFKAKNIWRVAKTIGEVFWSVYFTDAIKRLRVLSSQPK